MKPKVVLLAITFVLLFTMACLSSSLVEKFQPLAPESTPTSRPTKTDMPSSTPTSTETPSPTATFTPIPSPTVISPDIMGIVTSTQDRAANRSFVLCKMEGTNCTFTSLTTTSDETGYFEFYDVPAGDYAIFYDSGHEDFDEGVKKWEGKTIQMGNVDWLVENFVTKTEDGQISFTIVAGMAFTDNIAYMAVYRFFANSPFLWAHGCGPENCATPEDVKPVVAEAAGGNASVLEFVVYGPFEDEEETGEPTSTASADADPSQVIFQDDFSDPASGWDVSTDQISERNYLDGEYILRIGPGVSTTGESEYSEMYEDWAYLGWSLAGLSDLKNTAIDVDARYKGGTTDGSYGIIFYFQDRDHYYFYQIYPGNGQWALVERKPTGANDVVTWTPSDAILSGKKSNHLRLELGETSVSFYVNDQLVSTHPIAYQPGDAGLYTDTWNSEDKIFEAAFDNFTVTTLQ